MFARVASQASVSANSAATCSFGRFPRRASDSSPTSSMNHMKVPAVPRLASLAPNVSRIRCCNSVSVIGLRPGAGSCDSSISLGPCQNWPGSPAELLLLRPKPLSEGVRLLVLVLPVERLQERLLGVAVSHVDPNRVPGHLLGLGMFFGSDQQFRQLDPVLEVVRVVPHLLPQHVRQFLGVL